MEVRTFRNFVQLALDNSIEKDISKLSLEDTLDQISMLNGIINLAYEINVFYDFNDKFTEDLFEALKNELLLHIETFRNINQ